MSLKQIKDTITPDLRAKARKMRNPKRALDAMGRSVVSLGKRAFTQGGLRPKPWAPRKDDEPHPLLQDSTLLRKSIRHQVVGKKVIISSSRANNGVSLAAVHQLGSKKQNIPARPFLPFRGRRLTPVGQKAVSRALRAAIKADLGA